MKTFIYSGFSLALNSLFFKFPMKRPAILTEPRCTKALSTSPPLSKADFSMVLLKLSECGVGQVGSRGRTIHSPAIVGDLGTGIPRVPIMIDVDFACGVDKTLP